MSLQQAQRKIILEALDLGAGKTAEYLSKLSGKPWKCTVSSIHQDFTLSLISASPRANSGCWSARIPIQGGGPLAVQLLIDSKSVETISEGFSDIFSSISKPREFSQKDMVGEVSNIVAHGFCGEFGKLSGKLLILSIPEVVRGPRGKLLEDGINGVKGADLIVISHIVMLSSAYFSIRCELYFYVSTEFMKSLLPDVLTGDLTPKKAQADPMAKAPMKNQ